MNCLCCGKKLRQAQENGWHKACIRRFFQTEQIPELDMDQKTLEYLAKEFVQQGVTVPGVQKKISLCLLSDGAIPRLTLVNYPTGYILKPQVSEFRALPEAEHLVMCMAEKVGIETVPHALVKIEDQFAYITKRIDRGFEKNGTRMYAMEDFCQLDLRLTQDKYKGSYERCAKVIGRYSSRKGLDYSELFLRLVFCFLVGNSDMHLKNFSLIEKEENTGRYQLSAAYDLLPVNVIMPEDTEEFALTMNGKKRNLHLKDFLLFAQCCHISEAAAIKMIRKIVSYTDVFAEMCRESYLPEDMKEELIELMEQRKVIFDKVM
ncbi:MAG: HipA domain-containing protein [Eubacteriales bacterium]|nr:HipA domain-containing protein [Eubacteriales bacterium]